MERQGTNTLTVCNISQNVASFCKKLENATKQMVTPQDNHAISDAFSSEKSLKHVDDI